MKRLICLVAFLVCCSANPLQAIAEQAKKPLIPSLAPIMQRDMPAIVNIEAQGYALPDAGDDEDSAPNRAKRPKAPAKRGPVKPRKFVSIGSGVVIDGEKGYVLTNAHVIQNASTITVTLHDGRRVKAKMLGADPQSDIAVLEIKAKKLHAINIGNSDNAKVGDFVIAIGNPFGLNRYGTSQTASFGIISAVQRNDLNLSGGQSVENFIQTDAAINPGNSGGALINLQGELIGINTAILAPYGGNIGIGFAIPINMAKSIMEQLVKYGSIHRGLMGIFVQHLTPELAEAFSLPDTNGALIAQVNQDSPAAKAGLKPGDIIRNINGTTITDAAQVKNMIGLLRVGSTVAMQVLRDGKPLQIDAKIADLKQHESALQAKNPYLFGLVLRDFSEQSPLHGDTKGVRVYAASENSAGWRAGLRPGDIIVSANNQAIDDTTSLNKLAMQSSKQLLLHVIRGPGSMFVVIR